MIDWTRVAQLRDEIGADDFDEVAGLFLMEVEDTLARLDGASADPVQIQELLHFLKGSALNLGFWRVSDMCSKGETDVVNGVLPIDINGLKALYFKSRTAFKNEYTQRFVA